MLESSTIEDKKFNGWKNWQTWNVSLWLNNDEGLYMSIVNVKPKPDVVELEANTRRALPDGTPDMDSSKEYTGVCWSEILEKCFE